MEAVDQAIDQPVKVFILRDPLSLKREKHEFPAGATVEDLLIRLGVNLDDDEARVMIGMHLVEPEEFASTWPLPGELMTVRLIPGPILIPLIIPLLISLALSVVGSLISMGLQMLLAPGKSQPKPTTDPQTYTITGGSNTAALYAIVPSIKGEHGKLSPMLAGDSYTEIQSNDQYFRMLLTLGYGPVSIDSINLGDTPLNSYKDGTGQVEYEIRAGYPDDPPITVYPSEVIEDTLQIGLIINSADHNLSDRAGTGWHYQNTATNCDEIGIDIEFPYGLVSIGASNGGHNWAQDTFAIEYAPINSDGSIGTYITIKPNFACKGDTASVARRTKSFVPQGGRGVYGFSVGVQLKSVAVYKAAFTNIYALDAYWVALRTYRHDPPTNFPGGAFIAVRIQASNQLNGTIENLNCHAKSILPTYDPVAQAWGTRAGSWNYNYEGTDNAVTYALVAPRTGDPSPPGQALSIVLSGSVGMATVASDVIPIQKGNQFHYSGWTKGSNTGTLLIRALFSQYEQFDLAQVAGEDIQVLYSGPPTSAWTQFSFSAKIPNGIDAFMRIEITYSGASGTALLDDFSITRFDQSNTTENGLIENGDFDTRLNGIGNPAGNGGWIPDLWDLNFLSTGTYVLNNLPQTQAPKFPPAAGQYSYLQSNVHPAVNNIRTSLVQLVGTGAMVGSASQAFAVTTGMGLQFVCSLMCKSVQPVGIFALWVYYGTTPGFASTDAGVIAQSIGAGSYGVARKGTWYGLTANAPPVPGGVTYARFVLQTSAPVAPVVAYWAEVSCNVTSAGTNNTHLMNPSFDYAGQATSNPAAIYRSILEDSAIAVPYEDSALHMDDLEAWSIDCDTNNRKFDGVFDTPDTVEDRLIDVTSFGRAGLCKKDGLFSIVRDLPQTTPVMHYTDRVMWNFQLTHTFQQVLHGVNVQFYDGTMGGGGGTWQKVERTVYDDGYDATNATVFQQLDLTKGCADPSVAWQMGRYWLASYRLRNELYQWYTNLQHLVNRRGDLVYLSPLALNVGLGSGRITALGFDGSNNLITIVMDEEITISQQGFLWARVSHSDGTFIYFQVVNPLGVLVSLSGVVPPPQVVRQFSLTVSIAGGQPIPAIGDLAVISPPGAGDAMQVMLRELEPQADAKCLMTGVAYAPAVYTAELGSINSLGIYTAGVPPFVSPTEQPSPQPTVTTNPNGALAVVASSVVGTDGSSKPQIVIALASITALQLKANKQVVGMNVSIRTSSSDSPDVPWTNLGVIPIVNRAIVISSGIAVGLIYDIQMSYLYGDGSTSPPIIIEDNTLTNEATVVEGIALDSAGVTSGISTVSTPNIGGTFTEVARVPSVDFSQNANWLVSLNATCANTDWDVSVQLFVGGGGAFVAELVGGNMNPTNGSGPSGADLGSFLAVMNAGAYPGVYDVSFQVRQGSGSNKSFTNAYAFVRALI